MRKFPSLLCHAAALAALMLGVAACTHPSEPPAVGGTPGNPTPPAAKGNVATPPGNVTPGAPVAMDSRIHPVKIVKSADGHWQLLRDGQPYFIKGAGGDASKEFLADIGGNSFRTWGVGNDTPKTLAEAQRLGLTVTLGYWLGVKRYFSYTDEAQNQRQIADVRAAIERYKDSPPLLIWALGNEMENGFDEDGKVRVFKHIEILAKMAHELDPNHPTMTVVAEIGGDTVQLIHKYCPDIDIVGINSYAGCSSIADRYVKAGGTKPYIITEFGPPGVWEWPKDGQGAVMEPNSTEKAEWYRKAYLGTISPDHPLSLGSYVFAWGSKQEATATWYGLIMSDAGTLYHTKAVDVMQELWTGNPPAYRAPDVKSAKLDGVDPAVGDVVQPGALVKASSQIVDPQGLPITYKWHLYLDPQNYNTGGENQAAPPAFPSAIVKDGGPNVEVKMPRVVGKYRLFLFAYNTHGGVATANFPIKVAGEPIALTSDEKAAEQPKPVKLPLAIYNDSAAAWPWNPTGFMPAGIGDAMTLDAKCADSPHTGKTCIKVTFTNKDGKGWGGIVWQNPDNDWGTLAGGYDLKGAKVLSFWVRGANGGEKATFGMGLLKKSGKPEQLYWDTGSAELKDVILTKEWKHYTIPVEDKDLSRIKTGFWLVTGASAGNTTTFYLDDMEYLADKPAD